MNRILAAVQGFFVISSVACYDYARVPFESLQPGMEVRTGITGAGLDRIRRAPGRDTFTRLELAGQVVDVVPDTLYLGVPLSVFGAHADGGGETPKFLEPIPLSRAELTGTEERRLDRRKTFAAIAIGSLATAYAVYRLRGGGIITPSTTVTSPPENRVPAHPPRWGK